MTLLRKLRQEKGLSYKKLEAATGVGEITIRNIENKHYNTSNDRLERLANYFGVKDPKELTKSVSKLYKAKKCLNQRCPLNKECYCQSDQVIAGASCENQNVVSQPTKKVLVNSLQNLFLEY